MFRVADVMCQCLSICILKLTHTHTHIQTPMDQFTHKLGFINRHVYHAGPLMRSELFREWIKIHTLYLRNIYSNNNLLYHFFSSEKNSLNRKERYNIGIYLVNYTRLLVV